MYIIMLGAQGTGKGTVGGMLSKSLNLPSISTGDIFRQNIAEKTPLGLEVEEIMSKGLLVSDEITVKLVKNRLEEEDCINGAILDGFPRTTEQAVKFDEMLKEKGNKVDLVVNLVTPKEELIERMTTRIVCTNQECKAVYNLKLHPPKNEGICDKCGSILKQREDDLDIQAIENRLMQYETKTKPLVDFYNQRGVLRTETISLGINRLAEDVVNDILKDIK